MSGDDYVILPRGPQLSTPEEIRAWKPKETFIERAKAFQSDVAMRVARLTSDGIFLKGKLAASAVMAAIHPLLQAKIILSFLLDGYYRLAMISFACTVFPVIVVFVIMSRTTKRMDVYQEVFGRPPILFNVVRDDLVLLVLNVPNALKAGSWLPHGKQCYLKLRAMISIFAENLPWTLTQCFVWYLQESDEYTVVSKKTLALSIMSALYNQYSSYDYLKTYSKYTHEGVVQSFLEDHLRLGMGMAPPDLLIKLRTFKSVTSDVNLVDLTTRGVLSIGYVIGSSVTIQEVIFKNSNIDQVREKSKQTFVNFMDETCANRHLLEHIKFVPRVEMPANIIGRGDFGLRLKDITNGDQQVYEFSAPCNDLLFHAIESQDILAVRSSYRAETYESLTEAMGWCAKVGHWQALVELLAIVQPQVDKLTFVIRSACAENQQHCLQLLLDYGVKPDGMLECAAFTGAACAVKLLLSARADASEGCSEALHSAMFYDRPQMVKALLDGRADPKSWDNQGSQPLHTYAHYGCRLSIKELIAARADVNGRAKRTTKIGRAKTPLMIAAYHGQIETIKVLLGAGAYTDLKDLNGRTALDTAIHQGDEDATKILRATTCASPRSSTPLVGILEVRFLLSPDKPAREEVAAIDHLVVDHAGEAAILDTKNGAVEFSGSARVALKAPLEVGEAWTIMGWFRTPMPGWGQQCFQNMCANHGMNGSPVVMEGGLLGLWISQNSPSEQRGGGTCYCSPECNVKERLCDAPGWHHLAAVGDDGKTEFYIDGKMVGTAAKCNTDSLDVIGHMYLGGNLAESWGGSMRDFMVFKDSLHAAEVSSIFEAGIGGALT